MHKPILLVLLILGDFFQPTVKLLQKAEGNKQYPLYPEYVSWAKRQALHEYRDNVCPIRCTANGDKVYETSIEFVGKCIRCFQCSCDPWCHITGTCCPMQGEPWDLPYTNRSVCFNTTVGRLQELSVLLVAQCQNDYSNETIKHMCEDYTNLELTKENYLPVTSFRTKVS